MEKIRQAIQEHLDSVGDGWSVDQFVVAMGLVRITPGGEVESLPWTCSPAEQPVWQTNALLHEGLHLNDCAGIDSE